MLCLRFVKKHNKCCFHHGLQCLIHYSTVSTSREHCFAIYLVDSLGFSQQQALSISDKLYLLRKNKVIDSEFVNNANSVVALFHNLGFDDTLLRNIVSKEPHVLASKIDRTLKPKFRAFQDEDFSETDIVRIISRRPEILTYGLQSTILPGVHLLRQVMGSHSNVISIIERLGETYFRNITKCLLPGIASLSSYGVPIELIRKQLLYRPGYFVRNPEVCKNTVMRAGKKLGITRHSPMTNLCRIKLISGLSEETFESKCQLFKCFGGTNQSFSNYLVCHLGFSDQQALSTCTKLSQKWKKKVIDPKFIDKANSIVDVFQKYGFDDTLIRDIVSKEPRLLASNIDRTLKSKIRAFQDVDFSASDIIRIISRCPRILLYEPESTVLPAILVLKQVMGSNSKVIKTIERLRGHFLCIVKYLMPNVALLTSGYGIHIELIRKHILYQPGYYVRDPEVFKGIVLKVENKFRISRDSPMFLYCINLISGTSEDIFESKCQLFKSFGWTQSDLKTLIIKNACCFTSSEENIKKKLNFLMNELQLKPAYVKSRTGFITCSLGKRIVPRHKILLILKEKGFLKKNPCLYSAIKLSEPCFLKRFVLPFEEVREAYAELTKEITVSLHRNPQFYLPQASGHHLCQHYSQLNTQNIEPISKKRHQVKKRTYLPSSDCTPQVRKHTNKPLPTAVSSRAALMRAGVGEILEVEGGHIIRATGRKGAHVKVCTAKGPRDRRVRLDAHTAIQLYDVQYRLGYDTPSKAVHWLIKKAKASINELDQLPAWSPTNLNMLSVSTGRGKSSGGK